MSTRACPTCGAPISEASRFCGQCGTTISAGEPATPGPPAPAPAPAATPNVHDELTVVRGRPGLDATVMDPAPFGHDAAPAPAPAKGTLAQTINDPHAEARAREMRDAMLGVSDTAQAPPVAPNKNLAQTIMMGAADAPAPAPAPNKNLAATIMIGAANAPAPDAGAGASPSGAGPDVRAQSAASPLSKSVFAPHSPFAPPNAAPGAAGTPAEAAPAQSPPAHAAGNPALRTMLGMPARDLNLPPGNVGGSAGPLGGTVPLNDPAARAALPADAVAPNPAKTMLGVAIPGIAPTHGPQAAPPADPRQSAPQGGPPPDLKSKQSTMLGVAIPGIAPSHGVGGGVLQATAAIPAVSYQQPMPSKVQNTALGVMAPPELSIAPRPKTLIDEPLPAAPQIPQQKGVPVVAVVGILLVVVAALGGVGIYFAARGGGSLTAVPQLDETGRESLKIGCPTCPDGTVVALGASSATVTASAAVLPLPAPLSIGENDLSVKIDRPAAGRDEDVKVHVPVAYRVRADLSTLSARPPSINVRVEATPGSTVSVEDTPVTLDATGRGSYAIDLSKETAGTGEPTTFERKIPFSITPKGGKLEHGQLTARTAIVPIALDAPGRELVTDKTSAAVAGQTRAGTALTIDGQSVPVDAQGRFGVRVELAALGDKPLEIVASAPPLAPRIVKVKVTRVASLEAAAKGEDAQNPVSYDVFGVNPASHIGKRAMIEGEVVEARATAGHTVLIIDDKKACAKGATCLVRVRHGEDDKAARGDTLRAYGRVLGSVTAGGKTMPDLEAALVVPLKAARK